MPRFAQTAPGTQRILTMPRPAIICARPSISPPGPVFYSHQVQAVVAFSCSHEPLGGRLRHGGGSGAASLRRAAAGCGARTRGRQSSLRSDGRPGGFTTRRKSGAAGGVGSAEFVRVPHLNACASCVEIAMYRHEEQWLSRPLLLDHPAQRLRIERSAHLGIIVKVHIHIARL